VLKKVTTEVQIPAGVDDEMRVRIAGEGEASPSGGPPGDCYCFISVLPHPLFERDGQNLVCRVPITYAQAALGTTLEVPTLEGRGEITIPAGSQSGTVFKLNGKGMPDPRRRGLGDLLVQVFIEVPKKVSKEEQALLRELAALEQKHVAPERKSFFAKLKDYFTAEADSGEQSLNEVRR
jgi:molecular chaperone DnaJ